MTLAAKAVHHDNTYYDERTNSIACLHCLETIELRRSTYTNPELLMAVREQYEMDHAKCNQYKDIDRATHAREHRTEGARMRMHEARRKALRVLGGTQ